MCGLVGSLHLDSSGIADPQLIIRMRESLRHRGPDDCGLHIQGRVGLGFRRLSIIDVSGGHQPMVDDESGLVLVFNGEVYNYRELRAELETLGQRFMTESDTEVVLKSYAQWGREAVNRFIGQFAFAVWNSRTQELLLVRDRLGIKPLYWTRVGDEILFASEVKAFFQHSGFRAEADLDAVSSYLTFRQAVWDICYFKGVYKVLPGHFVSISDGGITDRAYWELPLPHPDESLDETAYLERVDELLAEATGRCMISDVPLGAYLSGGLDSSILVAVMNRQSATRLRTFSIGYEEQDYDEGQYAREVAHHFKTEHLHVIFPQQDYQDDWLKLLRLRDAPLSIPHEIALYHLSVELKKSVTVAISGEGADELFGGYGRVMRSPMDWKKVSFARSILGDSLSARLGALPSLRETPLGWLRCRSQLEHFFQIYNWLPFEEKWSLMSGDVLSSIEHDARTINVFKELFARLDKANPYDRILHIFQKIHLGCLLDRLDAMSMAASVEGRVPFVDHKLIEFVINMPVRYKLRWKSQLSRLRATTKTAARASEWLDTNKYLLRKLGSKLLPDSISRRKKLGFPTPLDGWLRDGLMDSARELLLDKRTRERGIFEPQALARLLDSAQNLPYDFYGKKVWMLMNVELWFREFIDAQPRQQTAPEPHTILAA
jgi:asparagine synthase (glutamine-hydrolyzing)